MKRFVKCLLVPAVVIAGMVVVGADKAEARRWVRRPVTRVTVGPRYYYRDTYRYRRPGVHVRAPGVRVNVGPRGYGGTVVAPGVRVGW